MKKILKKNQLMITALALMLAIAGYLQFSGKDLEKEYLTLEDEETAQQVAADGVITNNFTSVANQLEDTKELAGEFADTLIDLSGEELQLVDETVLNSEGMVEIESFDQDVVTQEENYLASGMDLSTPIDGEIPGEAVFTGAEGIAVLADAKLLKEQTRARNKETLLAIINSVELDDAQKQSAIDHMVGMTEVAEKEAAAEILLEAKGFQDVVVSISEEGVDVVVNALELSDAQRAQIEDIVKRKTQISAEDIIISTVVND